MHLESTAVSPVQTCLLYTKSRSSPQWLQCCCLIRISSLCHWMQSTNLATWKQYQRVRWQHSVLYLLSMLPWVVNGGFLHSTFCCSELCASFILPGCHIYRQGPELDRQFSKEEKLENSLKSHMQKRNWKYTLCLLSLTMHLYFTASHAHCQESPKLFHSHIALCNWEQDYTLTRYKKGPSLQNSQVF